MEGQSPTRREVLVQTTAAAALATCAASLCGCQAEKDKPKVITTGTVNIGPASNYPAGSANTNYVATHGFVVCNDTGVVLAIRPKCTHMGCTAKWDPKDFRFECPCHGSQFDLLGQAIKGPAKKPLPSVIAQRQPDATLLVDLDKLYAQ